MGCRKGARKIEKTFQIESSCTREKKKSGFRCDEKWILQLRVVVVFVVFVLLSSCSSFFFFPFFLLPPWGDSNSGSFNFSPFAGSSRKVSFYPASVMMERPCERSLSLREKFLFLSSAGPGFVLFTLPSLSCATRGYGPNNEWPAQSCGIEFATFIPTDFQPEEVLNRLVNLWWLRKI